MIENRNLAIGTRLVASYKKQTYVCTVEAAEEGEGVVFALEGGKKFKSPSAAATAVMNGAAANGWRFWSLEGEATAAAPAGATKATRGRTQAEGAGSTPKPERSSSRTRKPAPAPKVIVAHEDQTDVPQGHIRIVCYACNPMVQIVEGDTVPSVCPAGHRIDDPELTGGVAEAEAAEAVAEAEQATEIEA